MENLSSAELVALGGALVQFGGYHALMAAPQLRRGLRAFDSHDVLLGGGTARVREETRAFGERAAGERTRAAVR